MLEGIKDIKCEPGCGNCCPYDCEHLDCESGLCTIHPTIIGEEAYKMAVNCFYVTPFELLMTGYYCRAIVGVAEEMSGVMAESVCLSTGPVFMRNYKDVRGRFREELGLGKIEEDCLSDYIVDQMIEFLGIEENHDVVE